MRKVIRGIDKAFSQPWNGYSMLTYVIVGVTVSLFVPESWIQ